MENPFLKYLRLLARPGFFRIFAKPDYCLHSATAAAVTVCYFLFVSQRKIYFPHFSYFLFLLKIIINWQLNYIQTDDNAKEVNKISLKSLVLFICPVLYVCVCVCLTKIKRLHQNKCMLKLWRILYATNCCYFKKNLMRF